MYFYYIQARERTQTHSLQYSPINCKFEPDLHLHHPPTFQSVTVDFYLLVLWRVLLHPSNCCYRPDLPTQLRTMVHWSTHLCGMIVYLEPAQCEIVTGLQVQPACLAGRTWTVGYWYALHTKTAPTRSIVFVFIHASLLPICPELFYPRLTHTHPALTLSIWYSF